VGTTRRVPSREQLLAQLVDARLAGEVATPRANSLSHMDLLAKGDPKYLLGLDLAGHWPTSRIEALMAKRLGTPPGGVYPESGGDWIDPELVVDTLDRLAARLRRAVADQDVVLVATGHPGGLLEMHQALAAGLAAAGLTVTVVPRGLSASGGDVRQVSGVAVLHSGGSLLHTHSPRWMQLVLAALAVGGQPRPDLVIADHGWAGAAGQSGLDTVCIADCNDPALFVAEEMGTVSVTVPLEDNAPYESYRPMTAYILDAAGLPLPDLDGD
jgi:Phosphatase